jgi:hypothetical protein
MGLICAKTPESNISRLGPFNVDFWANKQNLPYWPVHDGMVKKARAKYSRCFLFNEELKKKLFRTLAFSKIVLLPYM